MGDEAHFHLNGVVNKENYRYWAVENPRNLHERPLQSPTVTVWRAISKRGRGISLFICGERNHRYSQLRSLQKHDQQFSWTGTEEKGVSADIICGSNKMG